MITAFGARPPQYKNILELDRMIKDIDIPDYLRSDPAHSHETVTKLVVRRWIILSNTEWSTYTYTFLVDWCRTDVHIKPS